MVDVERHIIAWYLGLSFSSVAVVVSCVLIYQHLTHWVYPRAQRYVVRILLMVPIYAIDSWLSLRFKDVAVYIDAIRGAYESWALYSFISLLVCLLGSEKGVEEKMRDEDPVHHPPPCGWCMSPMIPDAEFVRTCRRGALQFVLVKPILAVTTLILELAGVFHEGHFAWSSGWVYVAFLDNISITWAMYSLVIFYKATKHLLHDYSPLWKFACIKAVLFLSFWQGVVLSGLSKIDVIHQVGSYTASDVQTGLQDFMICFEMMLIAVAHIYAFPWEEFVHHSEKDEGEIAQTPLLSSIMDNMDVSDVLEDTATHILPGVLQRYQKRKDREASLEAGDDASGNLGSGLQAGSRDL